MVDVIDDPPFRLWAEITNTNVRDPYGQFVFVAIDPVASVAVLDDEQARREAALLPRTRFLAMVFADGDIPRLNAETLYLLNLEFYLIGRGLPNEHPEESIPIFPAAGHPENRAPLHLSPPLPWTDLYMHTRWKFAALVSRIHRGSVVCPTLASAALRMDVMRYIFEDEARPTEATLPTTVLVARRDDDDASSQALGSSGSATSKPDSIQLAYRVITAKASQVEKHVEVWMDLSSFPDPATLGNPVELFSILEQLQGVWERWESRALAALSDSRAETGTWAQNVANETIPHRVADAPRGRVDAVGEQQEVETAVRDGTLPASATSDTKSVPKESLKRRFADAAHAVFKRFRVFVGRKSST